MFTSHCLKAEGGVDIPTTTSQPDAEAEEKSEGEAEGEGLTEGEGEAEGEGKAEGEGEAEGEAEGEGEAAGGAELDAAYPKFVAEPEASYYIIRSRPVTITCQATGADRITFNCNAESIPQSRVQYEVST